jgi:diaminopimelate decarboxylase
VDSDIRDLVKVVRDLVFKVDGLLCHFSSIDADYGRVKETMRDHEARIRRLEKEHNFEPEQKIGESSALFPAVRR